MKKNIFVLPLIIILLVIFLPLSIYGLYNHITVAKKGDNPSHLPKLNGKLYFYNQNDKLLGTYNCESDDCALANTSIDDEYLNYYNGEPKTIDIMQDNYVFITDNNQIKLYSINNSRTIANLKNLKNYGKQISNNLLLIKNEDDLYGMFSLENMAYIISPEYDFMGLNNSLDENDKLKSDKIVVSKNDKWYLINQNNEKISKENSLPIYDYNDNIIAYKDNNRFVLANYDGANLVGDYITDLIITSEEVVYLSSSNVKIYNESVNNLLSSYSISGAKKIEYGNRSIKVYDNDNKLLKEISISGNAPVVENSQMATLRKNAKELLASALKAYDSQNLYNKDLKESICFNYSWLYSNHYTEEKQVVSSVYVTKENNSLVSYIWISDGTYFMGSSNTDYLIGGIKNENVDSALIDKGNFNSTDCGGIIKNPMVDYKNN